MSLRSRPSASAARQSAAILMAVAFSGLGSSAREKIGLALHVSRSAMVKGHEK